MILVTYNRSHYLRFAIEAILNQTYNDFDLIILNNGSTDDTEEVIKRYKDNKIRYIKHDENKLLGLFSTIKDMCNTKYLLITHDDDIMEPTMIEREMQILESDEEIVAVSCAVNHIDEENHIIMKNFLLKTLPHVTEDLLFNKYDYFHYYCQYNVLIFAVQTMIVRKKVFDDVDHDLAQRVGGMYDLYFILLINEFGKLYVIKEPLFNLRIHRAQLSRNRIPIYE